MMLHQPTIEKLEAMRLHGMAQAWRELLAQTETTGEGGQPQLTFNERMTLLVDRQFTWRQNEAMQARLRRAKLRPSYCVENVDYRAARGLDRALVRSLTAESAWVARHENIFICGPTGAGKSFLGGAFAHKACRDGYSALSIRAVALFRDLGVARADGSLRNLLTRLSRIDVLVVDDFAMAPMAENERRDFWEICEDRYQTRSLVLTSQLPVAKWHEQIGDPTVADGILDRIVHNSHRIEIQGESFRKSPPKAAPPEA